MSTLMSVKGPSDQNIFIVQLLLVLPHLVRGVDPKGIPHDRAFEILFVKVKGVALDSKCR